MRIHKLCLKFKNMICVCSWLLVRSGASFIFKNVRLLCFSWFLFCHNEIWNDRLKGLKQQRIYSSNRQIFVETDTPKTWEQVLLSYAFLYLLHLHFGCALCKIGLVPTTNQERKCRRAYTQGLLTVSTYIPMGSVVYVFP